MTSCATSWQLEDDFLTGSYRRDTKTKKLKDVDIFVVIDPKGPQGGLRDKDPVVVLEELRRAARDEVLRRRRRRLRLHGEFGERRRGHVVRRRRRPSSARAAATRSPTPIARRWIATNPKNPPRARAPRRMASATSKFVPFVKMIKGINRELRASRSTRRSCSRSWPTALVSAPFGRYQDEIAWFLASAAERIVDDWPDPAEVGPDSQRHHGGRRAAGGGEDLDQLAAHRREGDPTRGRRSGARSLRRVEEPLRLEDAPAMSASTIFERQNEPEALLFARAFRRRYAVRAALAPGSPGRQHRLGTVGVAARAARALDRRVRQRSGGGVAALRPRGA